jgi:hypothetical protein
LTTSGSSRFCNHWPTTSIGLADMSFSFVLAPDIPSRGPVLRGGVVGREG